MSATAVILAMGCRTAPTPEDESSTSSTSESVASDDATPPDVGFELPEGCGDGVVVPGQYCYEPVPIEGLERLTSVFAVDFDEDGREELIAVDGFGRVMLQLAYEDGRLVERARTEGYGAHDWTTEFDGNGDGQRDLLLLNMATGPERWHHDHAGVLGPMVLEPIPDYFGMTSDDVIGPAGIMAPMDLDGDQFPEFVAAIYYWGFGIPMNRVQVLRRGPTGWALDAPAEEGFVLPGCGWFSQSARADLDEDGRPELVVLDDPLSCDPIREEYDPEYHRFLVFGTDPETGALAMLRTVPVGAKQATGYGQSLWAQDVDADGHVDVVINNYGNRGMLHRGRGDGTFAAPVQTPAVGHIGQLDGDAAPELVGWDGQGMHAVDGREPGMRGDLIYLTTMFDPPTALADVNGDGLDDILVSDAGDETELWFVLVSAP